MTKYQGGKVGSLSRLREQLKKGGGGAFIKNVPANDVMVVRFLTEPDDWYGYKEAYDTEVRRYFPVLEGMEITSEQRVSNRFLAIVLDVTEDKVIPLKMPKDLANRVLMRYDRYETIMDRDYELSRMGEGLDTTYDCAPGDKVKRNLAKYELLDLDEVIAKAADYAGTGNNVPESSSAKKAAAKRTVAVVEDDDDDEEEETPVVKAPVAKVAPKRPAPAAAVEDDDDEEDEDDEDDEDEAPAPAPVKKSAPVKKAAAKPAVEEDDSFPEDDDDDDDDDDDAVAAADEEGGDDSYSEAELQAMSLRDLRALAEAYGIDHAGLNKAALIEAIMYE
ncbi:Rho termination factor, N-terminal [uncultured Caudovirales phage]|uniref:Rho termination factor, N-terminal n=1 Tax=uncultured Caudovirales phage TaxID=2100421 RepID=A0A6J5RHA0_9CAUD|nr:Rho termination factor, N-terminal [uncultured Caudovirales phage]